MIEYPKDRKYYKSHEKAFASLRFYEDDGDPDFDRLYSFSVEGDEAKFFVSKNDLSDARICFTTLKTELRNHEYRRYDLERMKKAIFYVSEKGTDKDGRRYIDLAAYDDLAVAAREAEENRRSSIRSKMKTEISIDLSITL